MNKQALIDQLATRHAARGHTLVEVAARAGLTEKSVRNALGPLGNPRLSSLLALADALDLELQFVPKGFGPPGVSEAGPEYRPITTVLDQALRTARTPSRDKP